VNIGFYKFYKINKILQKVFIVLCLDKEEMHQTLEMVCKKWAL